MSTVQIRGVNYERSIPREALIRASPIFAGVGDYLDVSSSRLSKETLNALFDLIEKKTVPQLSAYNFLSLLNALKIYQMDLFIPELVANFRNYITKFNRHEFAELAFFILSLGFDPNLTSLDLRFIPMYDPFEHYVIDSSKKSLLDYSYFSTVPESRYSSLMPWHLTNVKRAFEKEAIYPHRIIDMTGHIGVDSVFFGVLYPKAFTVSFEIDPEVFNRLRDNLVRYAIVLDREKYLSTQYNNERLVAAYLDDSTKYINDKIITEADLVYLDPPWGGPEYYRQKELKLYLSGINVVEIIRQLLLNGVPMIVLKAPANIDRSGMDQLKQINSRKVEIKEKAIYTKPKGGKLSYLLFFFK